MTRDLLEQRPVWRCVSWEMAVTVFVFAFLGLAVGLPLFFEAVRWIGNTLAQ